MEADRAIETLLDRGAREGCVEMSAVDDLVQRLQLGAQGEASLWAALEERGISVLDDCGRPGVPATTFAGAQLAEATTDSLSELLNEARRHPLLTAEQEVELFQRIEQGDREARNRMVASNLRLVMSIARRFQGQGLPLVDLIQEGVLGLMRAIDKFDWRRGYKFSTYATWWVRQSLQRGVANRAREIRLPPHILERAQRVSRTQQQLSVELGRPPTDAEVAERAGLPLRQVEELERFPRAVTSLDRPVGEDDDEGPSLGQVMAASQAGPEEEVTVRLTQETLDEAVGDLPDPERSVIRLRYGMDGEEPQTLRAVAARLGMSASQARRLEMSGLSRLAVRREVRALRDTA
jgi:RNA polymerase primary sigma factor